MKMTFWGVRGHIPVPGPHTMKYGGNTPCIEINSTGDDLVIIDSGTGIRRLGLKMMGSPFGPGGSGGRGLILMSHTHWDHIQGFPFFPPLFMPQNEFHLYGPRKGMLCLDSILEGQMNPNFNPVHSLTNLGASIFFHEVDGDDSMISWGTLTIRAAHMNHVRPREVLGFTIEENGRSVAVLTDLCYASQKELNRAAQFVKGCEVIVHDVAHLLDQEEAATKGHHSTLQKAIELAVAAGAKKLVPFHYGIYHTDEMIDAAIESVDAMGLQIQPSTESLIIEI